MFEFNCWASTGSGVESGANQRMKLTAAAILVSRDIPFLQAARQLNLVVRSPPVFCR